MLGFCYHNGIGTIINKLKAFELYHKAAHLKDTIAQYNLAEMYENGDRIKKDINNATCWYKKSAEQGDNDAQNKLDLLKNKNKNKHNSCKIN